MVMDNLFLLFFCKSNYTFLYLSAMLFQCSVMMLKKNMHQTRRKCSNRETTCDKLSKTSFISNSYTS